ncbi:uncharacterized protein LOC119407097 isoform X1 [Rhipicephalus sanguineus]|uniref:uncharacterized protein LOC119407097 isoform X1 n=1 Tax=Rhipicephalus sanguineus TaxID=34632 RepID=UPI001893B64C|nr:uncharacterized protein LOC119407097 isoform X1 [Rhipicephalus sanguineus]
MASVQRDHWSFVVLQFLLLSLLICRHGVFADRNKYFHISSLCMGERHYPQYKKIDGAVLTSESENNLECAVTFQTDSILQRFMLRFERLALDCHDHLVIFDGAHAIGNHKVDLSCRSTRSDVGTIFTQGNYVTLKYTTDSWSPQGNGFKLIITAYKDSSLPDLKHDLKCRDFECRNTFCISSNLTCDGVNHCGDNSDETSHALCIDDMASSQILGLGVSVFVTLALVVIVVCLVLCVGALCLCQRLQQQQQQRQAAAGAMTLPGGHPTALQANHSAFPREPLLPSHKVTRPATAPTGSSEQSLQHDLSACREQFSSPRPLDAVPPVSPAGVSPTGMFRPGSLSSQPDLLAVTHGGEAPPHTWANTLPRGRPDVLGPSFAIEHVETAPLPWDMHNGTLSTVRGKSTERPPDSVQVQHHSVVSSQPTGWEQTWL